MDAETTPHNGTSAPPIALRDGARVLTLERTTNALCLMEARTGIRTADHGFEAANGSTTSTRALLWALLQKHHSEEFATFEAVGDLVDRVGASAALEALAGDAHEAAPPDASPREAEA